MSLTTPTTAEINANIIAQLEASLNQTIPLLPKSFLRVLAKVMAGVFVLLYKYGGFMFLQIFVATASNDETTVNGEIVKPLSLWGRLIGVGDPVAATQAEMTATVTVTTQTGSLPSGSQLVNSDNGVTYATIGAVLLDAATVTVTVRAVGDQVDGGGAGALGNLDPGDVISFANPLANVAQDAVILATVVTGADAETTAAYRQRIIDRFQKRPQGGAYSDYESWGEEVAGIANVYPYTSANPGQVDCYVEATDEVDGIPTTPQLEAVLDSINFDLSGLASRRPANALANTFPIVRVGFDVEVNGLSVSDPVTVQANIVTAVEEYFLSREPFILGLTIPPRADQITQAAVGGVVQDVVDAAGGVFTSAIILLGAVPTNIYSLGLGEKAKASSVTFP